ncbi:MAG: VWA domain-containing protein [Pseudomonadales bacterium]|nr:VWA domain-containing protein [Pseudomonadales bacterium]
MTNNLFGLIFARFYLVAVFQRATSFLRSWVPVAFIFPVVFLAFCMTASVDLHAAPAKTDMRVVIDISGSMKKTDPSNLRIPAVKLMLNLAKEGDRFGVWTFGQYVNMLVPHKDVTPEWRKKALKQTELINSVALYTNIGLALEKASLNQAESDPDWEKTIVLLSDGKVDISKSRVESEKEKQRILTQVVPSLRRAGFKIHSVALSENADLDFLRTLGVDTGGSFSIARDADELLEIFVEASDKANAPEQVPLEGNEFDIDNTVNEFTALIFRKPGSPVTKLIDPRGKKYSYKRPGKNINWFNDKRYDLITVQAPRSGKWKLESDPGKGNRVTVVSDLNLIVKGLPDNVIEGERVTMRMYLSEQGKALASPDFLKLMDITFSQHTGAGEVFEGALSRNKKGEPILPKDGVYSAKLGRTLTDGKHEFNILVDGKTFRRKRTHQMTVHTDVLDVDITSTGSEVQTEHFLTITPKVALIDTNKLEILAQIQAPNGEKQVSTAEPIGGEVWQLGVPAFGGLGKYKVLVKVNGISVNGKPFELVQGPYRIDHTDTGLTDDMSFVDDELTDEMLDVDLSIDEEIEEPEPIVDVVSEVSVPDVVEVPLDEPAAEVEMVSEEKVPSVDGGAADVPEEDLDILVLGGSFLFANMLLLGGGFFLYRKMTNTQDATDLAEEQGIMQAQQARAARRPVAPAETAPVVMEGDGEEQTIMRPSGDMAAAEELTVTQIQPQKPVAAPETLEPQPTEEEDNAYVNTADPMELDDDEFIEIDDEFDELDDEMDDALDGLDELDVMLSEQEDAISDSSNTEDDKKDPFVNDEFQLDSPEE